MSASANANANANPAAMMDPRAAAAATMHAASEMMSRFNAKIGSLSSMFSPGGLFFLLMVVCVLGYLLYTQYTRQTTEQKDVNPLDTARRLQSIKDDLREQPLRNFYIKTALNCCCLGDWKDNYVDMAALQHAIAQGYRCLDFEIYSLNDVPVVGASTQLDNFYHMETYNHLDFMEVCREINDRAFSVAPNPDDPLLISLRIKSKNPNKEFIKRTIDCIKLFGNRLLEDKYNYEFGGQNVGMIPVKNFMGKVILMVDITNPITKTGCPTDGNAADYCLHQYINIGTTSPFMHKLSYEMQVKNAPNMVELIEHNKKNMSIVFPDAPFDANVNFNVAKTFGCQLVGMMPLMKDANLNIYNAEFVKAGGAFKLKPEKLCYQPVVIEKPVPQNPALSLARRNYKTDYTSWSG